MAGALREIDLFMVDMDGTFYLGDQLLPGALDFLRAVEKKGKRAVFLTNNSSRSNQDYARRMSRFGLCLGRDGVYTSGDAAMAYLRRHFPGRRLLVIGTESLIYQFTMEHFFLTETDPEVVVLGFDTTLDYGKLTRLCDAVRAGLPYIATHPDLNCPTENGYIPDIGAVIAFVKAATGREPDAIIGKPYAPIAEELGARFGVPLERTAMIGDRLYTDIAMGRWGITTALVLTGETKREDLVHSEIRPDHIFENIGEIAAEL